MGTITSWLWGVSHGGTWLFPLVVVSSAIDSINPCSFSVLLLTIAFLFSIAATRARMIKIGISYIIGIFVAYFLIGLGLLQALHIFNTPHFMGMLGAWLLIALGAINVINEFWPTFPIKLQIPHAAHHKMSELMDKASLPAAFLLGALVGLCEFPCTGGPYLMVVGLLHDSATYLTGVGYLLLYNVIFVLPLVVILFLASNKLVLGRVQEWQARDKNKMRLWSGVAMVALGIIILLL